MLVENCRFQSITPLYGALGGGSPPYNFSEIFDTRKLESLGYRMALYA